MISIKSIKDNLSQILALTEKNLKLELRFKYNLLLSFLAPIMSIVLPLIVMSKFLDYRSSLGVWNQDNFLIYQFIALNLSLIIGIRITFPQQLFREKNWLTLSALIIAPFNRINLLFGIFIAHILYILPPFTLFFIISYLYYPIHFITIITMIILYLLCALIFSGVGIILAAFAVSNENLWTLFSFFLRLLFFVSCVSYPFEIYPGPLQFIIALNPLFYIFDILRLTWIMDNLILTITRYTFDFILIISLSIIIPITGVLIFNKIYSKYGIVGY